MRDKKEDGKERKRRRKEKREREKKKMERRERKKEYEEEKRERKEEAAMEKEEGGGLEESEEGRNEARTESGPEEEAALRLRFFLARRTGRQTEGKRSAINALLLLCRPCSGVCSHLFHNLDLAIHG